MAEICKYCGNPIGYGHNYNCPADEIATLRAQLAEAQAESSGFRDLLERNGFRRCDIAACNCGSWHHVGGFAARFHEIEEVTNDYRENGETLLARIKRIVDTIARQRAWIEKAGHLPLCSVVGGYDYPCTCGHDEAMGVVR